MPNLLNRLSDAWSALTGRKATAARSAAGPVPLSSMATGFYGWGLYGAGPGIDGACASGPTYLNPVVGACVGWLARNFPEPDLRVVKVRGRTKGADEAVEGHPLLALLDRPNEINDFYTFFYLSILSDLTDGNTFWLKRRDRTGRIFDLWWLAPWDVVIIPDATRKLAILRYDVRVYGRVEEYDPSEIVHVKAMPDPMDPRRGMTPLASAAASIRTIDRMCLYDEALMTNFGGVPYMLSPSQAGEAIHSDNVDRLRSQWAERQGGRNTGKPFVSSQGLKAERLGFSPEEMALDKMPMRHTANITAAAGLSPMVLGLPDPSKTYANLSESREAAYENALMPLQGRFAEAIGRYLPELVGSDERVEWEYSGIECLNESRGSIVERVVKAVGGKAIMTRNEARAEIDLPPVEGGDEFAAPPSMAPGGGQPASGQQQGDQQPPPDGQQGEPPVPATDGQVNGQAKGLPILEREDGGPSFPRFGLNQDPRSPARHRGRQSVWAADGPTDRN